MATSIGNIQMFDSGTIIMFGIHDETGVVDLTNAQSVVLNFEKPDKSIMMVKCDIVGDPKLGVVCYITRQNDLDQAGRWRLQVVVTFGIDNIKHSNVAFLTVMRNLPI